MFAWDWRHRPYRHRQELLLRHTVAVLCQQTLRINFNSGWIPSEGIRLHIGVRLFDRAAVHLKLHSIAIGITVVHGKSNAVMNAPIWGDTHLLKTVVGIK